ncbi:F0F1 ATP synthase subunit delta [Candidatus Uhrbacteria bacterium]|nr:F0F1 ATP synthase subunit delta [Candidatus Uhrbacteria bacterium]
MKKNENKLARALVKSLEGADDKTVKSVAKDLIHELASIRETHRVRGLLDAIEGAWRERHGAATITIATAFPLSTALRKKLERIAEGAELREQVVPELIGGARLRVDEKIIEGSISGQLEQLSRAFENV